MKIQPSDNVESSDETKKSSLQFPCWREVIDSLFKTPTFNAAGLNSKSHAHYIQQLNTLSKKYAFPISEPDLMTLSFETSSQSKLGLTHLTEKEVLQQHRDQYAEQNQFTIVGDAHSMDFIYTDPKVVDVLGLPTTAAFTLQRICGMEDTHELFHPEDVIHTIRHGLAVLLVISVEGFILSPFSDYFQIEFRMGFDSPERFKTIKRICKLSNKRNTGNGTRHFDLWTAFDGHEAFRNVHTKVVVSNNPDLRATINALFYITNCILLDITPRDALFANYLDKYGYKHYRKELNNTSKTYKHLANAEYTSAEVSNIKSNLLKKIDQRIVENTKKQAYKSAIQKRSLHFKCGQLGLLGMQNIVERCLWKRVDCG